MHVDLPSVDFDCYRIYVSKDKAANFELHLSDSDVTYTCKLVYGGLPSCKVYFFCRPYKNGDKKVRVCHMT